MTNTARKRKLQLVTRPLTDEQIEQLTLQVLAPGDHPVRHAEAMLILADEMARNPTRADDIAYQIRRIAFSCLDDELIDAEVQMLRGEFAKAERDAG